jgi:hypothetical protein
VTHAYAAVVCAAPPHKAHSNIAMRCARRLASCRSAAETEILLNNIKAHAARCISGSARTYDTLMIHRPHMPRINYNTLSILYT